MNKKIQRIVLSVLALYTMIIGLSWSHPHRMESRSLSAPALADAINKAISDIYHIEITLIEYPSQGDFMWFYENMNQEFNEGTFDYISARVFPGDETGTAKLSGSSGFPNAYSQLIHSIYYSLGAKDTARIRSAENEAAARALAVVNDYEAAFGKIAEEDLKKAEEQYGEWAAGNKYEYIITVVMGSRWSGREPPLTYTEILNASGNLKELLPYAPANPGTDQIIVDVQRYLDAIKPVNSLFDMAQQNSWIIRQLQNNTNHPSGTNGGMKTFNPNTGAVNQDFQLGYTVMRGLSDIQKELGSEDRVLKVEMPSDPSGVNSVPFLRFYKKDGFDYNLDTIQGSSKERTTVLEYTGYTLVPVAPLSWDKKNNSGWYSGIPIAEAFKNGSMDVTGYKFLSPPPYNLGPLSEGGSFGYIAGLLICREPPKVTVTFSDGDFVKFKNSWDEKNCGSLKLSDGIDLGRCDECVYSSSIVPGSSNRKFSVFFSPLQMDAQPIQMSSAYVIGGVFEFPAVQYKSH